MRKGMDVVTMRAVRVDKTTGEVADSYDFQMRPTYGKKELARRRKENKAARSARRKNR